MPESGINRSACSIPLNPSERTFAIQEVFTGRLDYTVTNVRFMHSPSSFTNMMLRSPPSDFFWKTNHHAKGAQQCFWGCKR